jgi:hypothetical protein
MLPSGGLVAPQRLVARHADEIPPGGARIERRRERHVVPRERPHAPAARVVRRGQPVDADHGSATALDRQLVAELPVEPRDARDELHDVAPLGAPRVQRVEHRAHEAAATMVGARADQLRLARGHRHARERQHLRQEHGGRHDVAGRPVLDDERAVGRERRMTTRHQVARPRAERGVRLRRVLWPEHVGVERRERVRVVGPAAPEDESVAEVAEVVGHGHARAGPASA